MQPYTGTELSSSLVAAHVRILGNTVTVSGADDLSFPDNSHDYVVVFSVVHYFPDETYLKRALAEATRVARKAVLICDIRTQPREAVQDRYQFKEKTALEHLLVPKESVKALIPYHMPFEISPAYHDHHGGSYNLLIRISQVRKEL